jgi:putative heme degradation protein
VAWRKSVSSWLYAVAYRLASEVKTKNARRWRHERQAARRTEEQSLMDEAGMDLWQELLQSFEAFGSVRVLVSNGATTIEVDGQFGGFSKAGEFFNVQTETLDMHIRWQQLAAVFAVEKPGHMDGTATRSFQFFDQTGAAAFKVLLIAASKPLATRSRRPLARTTSRAPS